VRRSLLLSVVAVALVLLALVEIRTSALQALVLSQAARVLTYRVAAGPSPSVTYPQTGPYDVRLGYTRLPDFVDRLEAGGYRVEQQARPSTALAHLAAWGLYPPYREKTRAGLEVLDREGHPLYATRYPEQVYDRFDAVPPLLINTLLFIENRELLDAGPYRNPVVDWRRLAKAVGVETIGDLISKTEAELSAIPNFGKKSIEEVKENLAAHGLNLRSDED